MENNVKQKGWVIKLGIILMVSSGLFFTAGLVIPLLDLAVRTRIVATTISFIVMEIVFWTGGILVGKELFVKYKSRMNPKNWRRKSVPKES